VLLSSLRSFRDGLLSLAYPQQCRVCGGSVESWSDGVACAECWADPAATKLLSGSVCVKCGKPVFRAPTEFHTEVRACGMCGGLPFAAARACGVYSGALEASILFLKLHPYVCSRLRAIIRSTLSKNESMLASEVVIPIPLHHIRERQRGFNQATIIARIICREFNMRLDDCSLLRTKPTDRHRAGMDAADRAQSVERAFEVVRPRLIQGESILLVDDVYTSGSTICAATDSLMKAGARQVNVLTIARV
jgi:ComF family protein